MALPVWSVSHSLLSTLANTPLKAGHVDRLRRFEKEEARTLSIPLYDIGMRSGSPYIVFALLDERYAGRAAERLGKGWG
jgi:hypothetical protein